MRSDQKTLNLFVGVVGERENDPVGTAARLALEARDA